MQDQQCKRHFDSENALYDLPRKKFILEESFASDLAAMSLYSRENCKFKVYMKLSANSFAKDSQAPSQSIEKPTNLNKNIVRVEDINQFLSENYDSEKTYSSVCGSSKICTDDSGLPFEIAPGDERPKVPHFVLRGPELTDSRDISALDNIVKRQTSSQKPRFEVLNPPKEEASPIGMDID
ncbi:hypothetical protein BY458DRAFT_557229 [Sporodiniella umbellata]|nr:hypothetical protein BY458DRAFT_557229 [Sporodiniella umbellata]